GAIEEYRQELALYPEAYPARFNLSRLLHAQGRLQEERLELERCVHDKPDFGVAYLYLAKSLMDGGEDPARAQSLVAQGLQHSKENQNLALGHYLLADLFSRQGKTAESAREAALAKRFE